MTLIFDLALAHCVPAACRYSAVALVMRLQRARIVAQQESIVKKSNEVRERLFFITCTAVSELNPSLLRLGAAFFFFFNIISLSLSAAARRAL